MKTKHKALLFGSATILAAAIAFGSIVWGGVMTVAGVDPHYAPVEWALHTTMESSVRYHAADVEIPAGIDLEDPALAERAFGHYSVACTPCHGAPGVDAAPWLLLNPPAELLVETADQWSDEELYWIIKNGIKMTGMPALGPTHGDDDLWAISAMVRQLPTMTPEQYQGMAERFAAHQQHGGHDHGSMTMADTTLDEPMVDAEDHHPVVEAEPEPKLDDGAVVPAATEAEATTATTKEAEATPRRARPKRGRRSKTEAGTASTAPAPSAPAAAPQPTPSAPEHHGHHHHHHKG